MMPPKEIPYEVKARRYKVVGECWEYTGTINLNGYGQFHHRGKLIRAHRAMYEIVNGEIPAELLVCHTCDNRKCVNPSHLYAGTHADNYNDARSRGRLNLPHSENHHASKLNARDVSEIRSSNLSQRKLAKIYGVSHTTIGEIRRGLIWKTV